MPSDSSSLFLVLFFFFIAFALLSAGHATIERDGSEGIGRRVLLGLKETPHGSNTTFECSPAGPCLPCLYSEKKDDKYRCSETGYRIPLKCIEIKLKHGLKEKKPNGSRKSRSTLEISRNVTEMHDSDEVGLHRSVLDDSSKLENEPQAYITYRSCIPAVSEEKLSVVGFEVIMLFLLLISGSLYFRKRQTASMSGFGRIPNNSRF